MVRRVQTQEVTVIKAWSLALLVQRLRGLIDETGGHWETSVSLKEGEWDTCRDKSLCSYISLGKASW